MFQNNFFEEYILFGSSAVSKNGGKIMKHKTICCDFT